MIEISATSSSAIQSAPGTAVPKEVQLAELLLTVAALSENNPDSFSLMLSDLILQERPVLFRPEAWLAHRAHHSQPFATKTLEQARPEGAARGTLETSDATGAVASWDVVLSRMSRHGALLCVARDVTERMSQEVQLRRVAYQDGLTGLLNRAVLRERLDEQICIATRCGGSVAVLMLDLDNFKLINDTLGHDAGYRRYYVRACCCRSSALDGCRRPAR